MSWRLKVLDREHGETHSSAMAADRAIAFARDLLASGQRVTDMDPSEGEALTEATSRSCARWRQYRRHERTDGARPANVRWRHQGQVLMREPVKSRAWIDHLVTVAGILLGVFLYVVVRKYIAGTLPEPFESFAATLMR